MRMSATSPNTYNRVGLVRAILGRMLYRLGVPRRHLAMWSTCGVGRTARQQVGYAWPLTGAERAYRDEAERMAAAIWS